MKMPKSINSLMILGLLLIDGSSLLGQDSYQLDRKKTAQNYQEIDRRPIHFGFGMGLNTLDFTIQNSIQYQDSLYADITVLYPGFHLNIVTNYRLADNLSVRFLPGLVFGQRNVVYWRTKDQVVADMKQESNMLDFPIHLKYRAKRINNYRPYVMGGGNIRIDMAAKKNYDDEGDVYVKFKKLDYFYEFGFGIDFYLEYFKFTTEMKWSAGLRNMITDQAHPRYPQYVNVIDRMTSSGFLFSMYFE